MTQAVALLAALDEAAVLAAALADPGPDAPDGAAVAPAVVRDLLLRLLASAAETGEVTAALAGVPAGRALLRFTDAPLALAFSAGDGRLAVEPAEPSGRGPKVDATAATWLGLVGGTLRPWLAFTRGLVVCRAGLGELRWLQQVAERLQRGYADARSAAVGD